MWFPLSSPPSSSSTEIQQEVEKTETQILPELVGGGVGGVLAQPNCSSFSPFAGFKDRWLSSYCFSKVGFDSSRSTRPFNKSLLEELEGRSFRHKAATFIFFHLRGREQVFFSHADGAAVEKNRCKEAFEDINALSSISVTFTQKLTGTINKRSFLLGCNGVLFPRAGKNIISCASLRPIV